MDAASLHGGLWTRRGFADREAPVNGMWKG